MSAEECGRGVSVHGPARPARHWFLTGFSGSGKTTVGRALAALAGRPFVDLDDVVSRRLGCPPGEAFARCGEMAFRRAEADALTELGGSGTPSVVALGAGALESPGAMEATRGSGLLVWLDTSLATCLRRTERPGEPDRPVLSSARAAGAAEVGALHAARSAGYGAADLRVEASGTPNEVARDSLRRIVEAGEPLS